MHSGPIIGGNAEDLGNELVIDGVFSDITTAAAKVITGITKATPGVVTLAAGHGYVDGQVLFIEALDEMTQLNDEYWKIRSLSGNTCELSDAAIGTWDSSSLDTSGFAAETTGGTAKAASFTSWTSPDGLHPGVDGAGSLTNTADWDGEQASSSFLANGNILTLGEVNKSVYTVSNRASGNITLALGEGTVLTTHSADGTYTEYGTTSGDINLLLIANSTFIGSIDDVSVRVAGRKTSIGIGHNIIEMN